MNKYIVRFNIVFLLLILSVSCQSFKPIVREADAGKQLIDTGVASWYGPGFHGKKTANGEVFDTGKLTAAHRTLPFGTIVLVKNVSNGKEVEVRINDRGPFAKNRIIDLSKAAAQKIDMIQAGTASVKLYVAGVHKNPDIDDIKKATYTVQVASYQDYRNAKNKADQIPEGWTKQTVLKGEKVYRVFAGKFNRSEDAKAFLNKLKKQNISGFVKQIEN